jgi:hypothetical protein
VPKMLVIPSEARNLLPPAPPQPRSESPNVTGY